MLKSISFPTRIFAIGLAFLALAACETPQNNVTTSASGQTKIEIRSGLNCFDGKCFNYDSSRGLVSTGGRHATTPPVSMASGSLTPAQFTTIFDTCMRQGTVGSGGERG